MQHLIANQIYHQYEGRFTMKQTVAGYIAKMLADAGINRIWGVTGDSLNGLSDSLRKLGSIEWMGTGMKKWPRLPPGRKRI